MRRRWAKSEVEYLINANAVGESRTETAWDLHRPVNSIYRKASMLGLAWGNDFMASGADKRTWSKRAKDAAERIRQSRVTPIELHRKLVCFAGYYGWEAAMTEFGVEPETARDLAKTCAAHD